MQIGIFVPQMLVLFKRSTETLDCEGGYQLATTLCSQHLRLWNRFRKVSIAHILRERKLIHTLFPEPQGVKCCITTANLQQ